MRHLFIFVTASMLFALGCSSPESEGGSETTSGGEESPEFGNRPVTGECVSTYREDLDVTAVAVEVPGVGLVGSALPGDGWQVVCGRDDTHFVEAENRADLRKVTVTLDPSARGEVDVQAYAEGQAQHTVQMLLESGATQADARRPEILAEGVYVVAYRVTMEGNQALQLNAFHVFPTERGLLRYHISEIGDDPAAMNASAEALVVAASVFAIFQPEAVSE